MSVPTEDVNKFLSGVPNVDSLQSMFGGRRVLNLGAFSTHGTVEFRQHEATTNFDEIAKWVAFSQKMVETARRSRWVNEVPGTKNFDGIKQAVDLDEPIAEYFGERLAKFANA
jgi:hypothetical protein